MLICIASCATLPANRCAELNQQLLSENVLYKRGLGLARRENAVLREENIGYRRDLQQSQAQAEKLQSDIDSMKKKYDADVALWTGKYNNLMEKNRILSQESSEKIRELSDLNKSIEAKLSQEIARLNERTRVMEQDFGREKEAFKNQAAQREFALSRDLEGQKKIVEARDTEIQTLKGRINDINVQFVEANTKIDELTKETKLREARIKELEDRLAAVTRPAPEAVPPQEKKDAKDTKDAKDSKEAVVQRDDKKDGKK